MFEARKVVFQHVLYTFITSPLVYRSGVSLNKWLGLELVYRMSFTAFDDVLSSVRGVKVEPYGILYSNEPCSCLFVEIPPFWLMLFFMHQQ